VWPVWPQHHGDEKFHHHRWNIEPGPFDFVGNILPTQHGCFNRVLIWAGAAPHDPRGNCPPPFLARFSHAREIFGFDVFSILAAVYMLGFVVFSIPAAAYILGIPSNQLGHLNIG
jgi:hypothetical protein